MAWKDKKYLELEEKINEKLAKTDTCNIELEEFKKITSDDLPLKSGISYFEHRSAMARYFQKRGIYFKYYPAKIEFRKKINLE